jgi:hypothetical protein
VNFFDRVAREIRERDGLPPVAEGETWLERLHNDRATLDRLAATPEARQRRRARRTALAALLGWAALTAGLVQLTHPAVGLVSVGLLLLSLTGWRLVWTVMREGLYRLTEEPDESTE